jgi:hypothetical protein
MAARTYFIKRPTILLVPHVRRRADFTREHRHAVIRVNKPKKVAESREDALWRLGNCNSLLDSQPLCRPCSRKRTWRIAIAMSAWWQKRTLLQSDQSEWISQDESSRGPAQLPNSACRRKCVYSPETGANLERLRRPRETTDQRPNAVRCFWFPF